MEMLIRHHADMSLQDCEGYTAMMHTCTLRRPPKPELLKLLLDHGAPTVDVRCKYGYTPLVAAVAKNLTSCVRHLVDANASMDVMCPNGRTLLERARYEADRMGGHSDILDALNQAMLSRGRIDKNSLVHAGVCDLYIAC